nr:hypothetical protein CFP56_01381 [Quercus suber]
MCFFPRRAYHRHHREAVVCSQSAPSRSSWNLRSASPIPSALGVAATTSGSNPNSRTRKSRVPAERAEHGLAALRAEDHDPLLRDARALRLLHESREVLLERRHLPGLVDDDFDHGDLGGGGEGGGLQRAGDDVAPLLADEEEQRQLASGQMRDVRRQRAVVVEDGFREDFAVATLLPQHRARQPERPDAPRRRRPHDVQRHLRVEQAVQLRRVELRDHGAERIDRALRGEDGAAISLRGVVGGLAKSAGFAAASKCESLGGSSKGSQSVVPEEVLQDWDENGLVLAIVQGLEILFISVGRSRFGFE